MDNFHIICAPSSLFHHFFSGLTGISRKLLSLICCDNLPHIFLCIIQFFHQMRVCNKEYERTSLFCRPKGNAMKEFDVGREFVLHISFQNGRINTLISSGNKLWNSRTVMLRRLSIHKITIIALIPTLQSYTHIS